MMNLLNMFKINLSNQAQDALPEDTYKVPESNHKTGFTQLEVSRLQAWVKQLTGIENELNRLIESTEPQFLELGNHLYQFVQKSNDIAKAAIDSAHALSGEEITDATDDLEDMLERISHYLHYCDNELEHNFLTLQSVLKTTNHVDAPLEGFNKIVKKLHMLGVTTRIENARSLEHEGSNFEILSHDVLRMSDEINKKSTSIREGINQLSTYSEENLLQIKSRNEERAEQAQHIVANMQSCLNTLREKHALSSETAKRIYKQSDEISAKINKIVMSLQFHDICRQRLEHVIQAITEQRTLLESTLDALVTSAAVPNQLLQKFRQTCLLQQIQLRETDKNMTDAVDKVLDNLAGVYEDVIQESEHTEKLVSKSDAVNKCSLDEMETGIRDVECMLQSNVSIGIEINEVILKIANMVDTVSNYVVDINFIGSEIELIAMNGLISAAHMGESGAALSVVADAIQSLSSNAREQINYVSVVLDKIGSSTKDLRFGLTNENDKDGVENAVQMMVHDLDGFIQTFKHVTLSVLQKLDKVHKITAPFQISLQESIQSIKARESFNMVVNHCVEKFQDLVNDLEQYVEKQENGQKELFITDLEKNYTMLDEREAHDSFIQNASSNTEVNLFDDVLLQKAEISDDDLGDNIELF